MDKFLFKGAFACVAASIGVAQPAEAVVGCWSNQQAMAATVRDFQSKMMVSTLRCRAMGFDIDGGYNRMIIANRPVLKESNDLIKERFERAYGGRWQAEYDRYATSLANSYGGDKTDAKICGSVDRLTREAAASASQPGALIALAEKYAGSPSLPGGRCSARYAER